MGDMIRRSLMAVGLASLLLAVPAIPESATAEGTTAAGRCPRYRAYLLSARAHLEHGDRAGAVAELRRAEEALEGCVREEAAGANGLATSGVRAPAA